MKAILALLALSVCAADWPQFLGPNRDGVSTEAERRIDWPATGPKVLWSRPIGAGWAAPVVAADKLVTFHRIGDDEIVDCLDAVTGKERWSYRYRTRYVDDFGFDEGPRATPLITGETVITFGADGDLHALDLATGKVRWHRQVHKEYNVAKGFFGAACSPIRVGDAILLNVGGKGAGVVAFDLATGKERWKVADDKASYSSPTVASLDGRERVLFFTRHGLLGIDPSNGTVAFSKQWRPRLDASVNAATPLVWKDQIFISTSYQTGGLLVQVKKDELSEVWSNDDSMSNHYNTAVRAEDYLYGIHGRQEQRPALHCIDWKTGEVKWSKDRFGCAGLIRVGSSILAVTETGEVVLFDASPRAYQERLRARVLDAPVRALPALANGRLHVRDGKKLLTLQVTPTE